MNTLAPEFSALMTILRSTGPGDLDAAILKDLRDRRDHPGALPEVVRLLEKIGFEGGIAVQAILHFLATREQLLTRRIEASMKIRHETNRFGVRISANSRVDLTEDLYHLIPLADFIGISILRLVSTQS